MLIGQLVPPYLLDSQSLRIRNPSRVPTKSGPGQVCWAWVPSPSQLKVALHACTLKHKRYLSPWSGSPHLTQECEHVSRCILHPSEVSGTCLSYLIP